MAVALLYSTAAASVVDRHHIYADSDPTFYFDANTDPNPTLHLGQIMIDKL
jgi:hypothetical protein